MAECGVLCRYFFQQMLLEADDAQLEEFASSLLLSSRPTLAELRHKFPFEGSYHFRLQDVGSVLFGVKKALASKMKGSAMAQTLQKHSASDVGEGHGRYRSRRRSGKCATYSDNVGAIGQADWRFEGPATSWKRDHVDLLQRLWTSCFDTKPFAVTSPEWNRLGFRHGDPMREMQFVLPLQCLVYFHERSRGVFYALVGSQVAHVLADMLQLRDGGCLGSERPFWRMFEDPVAFFELFCIAFRAFASSWKLNSNNSYDVNFHLSYVGDFTQELLRRGPESLQNW
ncbi:ELMO domain [Phytophthora cactorum]|nr:ELMO domain [Phytophthora cactorum]